MVLFSNLMQGVRDPKLSERQIVNNSTEGMSLP